MAAEFKAQGAVSLEVVQSVADLPARYRNAVLAQAPDGRVRGAYFRRGDRVFLIADNIRGAEEFVFVALHESFHRGLAKTVPNSLPLLRQLRIQNQALRAATAEQMSRHGIGMDEAIEEALADMAGSGRVRELKGIERLFAAIREWVRKLGRALGLDMPTLSDDDLLAFIRNTTRAGLTAGVGVETGSASSEPMLQRAYHGTPHRGIDKFSTDKIGTGEGAQAYGWGLYFASKKAVAEYYRGGLSYRDMVRKFRDAMPDDADFSEALDWARSADAPPDMARVIKALAADDWLGFDYPSQALTALFKEPGQFDISPETAAPAKAMQGQLYEVQIPEDSQMLLWDKPLSEQPEGVRKALEPFIARREQELRELWKSFSQAEVERELKHALNGDGQQLYEQIGYQQGNGDRGASEYLSSLGIKGIKYLDGTSRAAGDGTYNYVIFSGDDVTEVQPMLSRAGDAIDTAKSALTARNIVDRFNDWTRTSTAFNWWHRTVGTQYHKANAKAADGTLRNPGFKQVYDLAQDYLHDTAAFANDPADMAPDLLPQLKTLRDALRAPALKKADAEPLARAVFGGTLTYTRDDSGQVREAREDETPGVVFTPDELRELFGFTDPQVKLYQQFRRATDRSLDILVASDVARLLGGDMPAPLRAMIRQGDTGRFKGLLTAHLLQAKQAAEADLVAQRKRHRAEMAAFWRKQKGLMEGPRGRAGARLALLEELEAEKHAIKFRHGGEKHRAEQAMQRAADLERTVREKYERIDELKGQGYAPLMRFGRYTVDVLGEDGSRKFFSMYETEREANAAARALQAAAEDGDVVTQGIMSQEAYKQFSGLTPETIELFAEVAGVEKTALFEEYLRRAKNNRSALKRLIKRTGVAGFSEDTQRVLASFLTSNARAASMGMHLGQMKQAVEDIPKEAGDVKDEASKLAEYVQNPQEEAQGIRGLLFAQYLGGSVASAMVNMTQPFMMTLPYLSQFGGPAAAGRRLAAAMKLAVSGPADDSALAKALRLAEKEGIVEPQELHQLQAEASRTVANHPLARRGLFLWGSFFSLAERFNRRVSFIAAYETAAANGHADPFDFAKKAVDETQGVYTKANRPNWARGTGAFGPAGPVIFTFKQYSISYVEFLKRLPRREQMLALAILVLAAGAQGVPGADDLDDIIDTVGQHLGYDTNAKLWKTRHLEAVLGEAGADFAMRGFSALPGIPLDVAGRLSLGNMIPGTAILRKDKADKAGEVTEVFGPAASTISNAFKALPALLTGDFAKAHELMGATAAKNLGKAIQMWMTGEYRDQAGRKVKDVTGTDAVVKAIGFQPAEVARDSRAASLAQQQIALARNVEAEIAGAWAQGIVDGDADAVAKARKRMADWNTANPESRISINRSQIQRRVREARMTRDARMLKRTPKEMRAGVAEVVN